MAGKLWLALTAVASLQENERRQARALEAQAWNGHSIISTAFCGPEQVIRLAPIQGIGKKTASWWEEPQSHIEEDRNICSRFYK